MTEFKINDRMLQLEAESIARIALEECEGDFDEARDYIAQTVDGHEYVIYNYKALKICTECNIDNGEAFLEEMGMPDDVTIYKLASIIVYGELESRALQHLYELETEQAA